MSRLAALVVLLAPASLAVGCGAAQRRYPLAEPLWVDADSDLFAPAPDEWYSPYLWDGADNAVFRPLSELFRLELEREAINVNAVDEVPDSSWFTGRLSRGAMDPETLARGACADLDPDVPGVDADVAGPFTITRGKPDGSTPGFFVRDARGITYLMKPDGGPQAGRWAASDAIGAAVFWAAGYHAPCNRVVLARREDFVLQEGAQARYTNGLRTPLTREVVDRILDVAAVDADGRLRFGLSQFIEGAPIAPWRYEGTWDDDPNDVVPHQHRRDLRAMYVLSSWLGHIDARQENTMASWIEVRGGRGYVRHYVLDFSDTLGIGHVESRLEARFGHSGYFDLQHIAEDLLTLGAVRRPWDTAHRGAAGAVLGFYDVEHYEPDAWRPGYPNPAYDRMTERDAAWMARILARFGDPHLRALVARARFGDPVLSDALFEVLAGRRDRALERWLTRLSPLALPAVASDGRVCSEDLAVRTGIRERAARRYEAWGWLAGNGEARALEVEAGDDAMVCVRVPRDRAARPVSPSYAVIDVVARSEGAETTGPLRVHAYDLGVEGLRIVGVERLAPGARGWR